MFMPKHCNNLQHQLDPRKTKHKRSVMSGEIISITYESTSELTRGCEPSHDNTNCKSNLVWFSNLNYKTHESPPSVLYSFIHSFILETYIAPLQDTATQRRSQPSHGQRRRMAPQVSLEGPAKNSILSLADVGPKGLRTTALAIP